MAFSIDSMVKVGGNNNAQSLHTYETADARSEVTGSGYFDGAFGVMRLHDYILVRNTSEDYLVRCSSDTKPITAQFLARFTDSGQETGWVQVIDSTYTSGAPQSASSGVRTKIDLNSDSVIESQSPFGTTAATFYNPATKLIFGEGIGDALLLRLQMTVKPAQTNGTIDFDIDIGGTQGIILRQTLSLAKGTNPFPFTQTFLVYTLGEFQANGGTMSVTPTVNVGLYDMSLLITRTHKGV